MLLKGAVSADPCNPNRVAAHLPLKCLVHVQIESVDHQESYCIERLSGTSNERCCLFYLTKRLALNPKQARAKTYHVAYMLHPIPATLSSQNVEFWLKKEA